jgi:hypothetical protein
MQAMRRSRSPAHSRRATAPLTPRSEASEPLSDAPSNASDDSQAPSVAEYGDRELYLELLVVNSRVCAVVNKTTELLDTLLTKRFHEWTLVQIQVALHQCSVLTIYVDSVQGTPPQHPAFTNPFLSTRFHQLAFINPLHFINSLSSTRFHQLAFINSFLASQRYCRQPWGCGWEVGGDGRRRSQCVC